MNISLYHGDCLVEMNKIADKSVDAVITDPPYPCIKRSYGYWTVDEWWDLMMDVCDHTRRILKPTGSAVFILQPNSEHVGQLRGWLWEFMAWVCEEWNIVQDAWWWNVRALPVGGAISNGLLRGSLKACIWAGTHNCYRNQDAVLWSPAQVTLASRATARAIMEYSPSGRVVNRRTMTSASERRGGVTPYNVLPVAGVTRSHGASTPLKLADWWTRYIVPEGGIVCDPFIGSGTMGVAAIQNGCNIIGIDKEAEYIDIARERIYHALSLKIPRNPLIKVRKRPLK